MAPPKTKTRTVDLNEIPKFDGPERQTIQRPAEPVPSEGGGHRYGEADKIRDVHPFVMVSGPNSDSFGIAKDFRPGITHIKNNDSLPPAASDVPFTDEQNEALAANMEAALSDVDKDDPSTDPNF